MNTSRRSFLQHGTVAAGAAWLGYPAGSMAQMPEANVQEPPRPTNGFPRQNPKLVEETVGASHGKFDRVKELVTAYPELAKTSIDQGFGDWESPVDAASHVGNREIALFLIEYGARPTLFTFAMLGELDAVKAQLGAAPALRKTTGPHGLNLYHHAKAGGEQAKAVLDYLVQIGETEAKPPTISQETIDTILGKYESGGANPARFEILTTKMGLAIQGEGGGPRRLTLLPDGTFHPVGADSVRLKFELAGARAASALIKMGADTIRATRTG